MIKELENKSARILVIGLGYRTGLATSNFLASKGYSVDVSDTKDEPALREIIGKLDARVTVFPSNQEVSLLDNGYDLIVLSPGVPAVIPLVVKALERGIKVIAEVELAYYFMRGMWVAITGTDGKSTTTAFTNHVMKKLGLNSCEGGNIGIPLISLADASLQDTVTVAELSSFQLETIDKFHPNVALLTNLTPDHLDRYAGIDDYFDAKLRISRNQTPDDFFIYNADDPEIRARLGRINATKLGFSLSDPAADAYYDGINICLKSHGAVLAVSSLRLIGLHNVQNCMSAILLSKCVFDKKGIPFPFDNLHDAIFSFGGLAHRMELAGTYKGRRFINDSKATTIGAVEMALKSVDENSVFIIGGRAKGDDYSRLAKMMKGRVKGVILIGETSDEFAGIFSDFSPQRCEDLEDAIRKSLLMTKEGDTVVLSPACASFDMFKSFEHRGDEFKKAFAKVSGEA